MFNLYFFIMCIESFLAYFYFIILGFFIFFLLKELEKNYNLFLFFAKNLQIENKERKNSLSFRKFQFFSFISNSMSMKKQNQGVNEKKCHLINFFSTTNDVLVLKKKVQFLQYDSTRFFWNLYFKLYLLCYTNSLKKKK